MIGENIFIPKNEILYSPIYKYRKDPNMLPRGTPLKVKYKN